MLNSIEQISSEIKKLRQNLGWTQNKLSNLTKISQSTICRMEIDCSNVRLNYVVKVFEALSNSRLFQNPQFYLQETEISAFWEKIKSNDRAWSMINYNPKKSARLFIEICKKEF